MGKNIIDNKLVQYQSFFWSPDYLEPSSAWIEHIPFAFWIIEVLNPKILVELGVHSGTSYFSFCQAAKTLNLNTLCYGVDTWKGDEHAGFYGEEIFEKVANHNTKEFSRFSTLVKSTFDEAKEYFIDGSIDLLHIDGLHTYEAVKHDFEAWLPKLSDGGLVIFHDINVREKNFGVFKLWEELKQKYRHFQFDFGYGLGIVAVGKIVQEELKELFNVDKDETYYAFLRNLFSERGSFFKVNSHNDLLLEQQRNNLEVQAEVYAQLSESYKILESHNAQLSESHKTLELYNAQLTESHKTLELHNAQLSESHKILESHIEQVSESHKTLELHIEQLRESHRALELQIAELNDKNKMLDLTNGQLRASFEAMELENLKLKQNHKELIEGSQRKNAQLQEKYQKDTTDLLKKIKEVEISFDNKLDELSAAKKENELFKKYISWYHNTYENRSILGVLKEKIRSRLKKKINYKVSYEKFSSKDLIDQGSEQVAIMLNAKTPKSKKKSYYLNPANDIELTDQGLYTATGDDPFFLVDFKNKRVKRGWYWLSVKIQEDKGTLHAPKLYYDCGKGFNEENSWQLPNTKNGKIESLVEIPVELKQLRFDPTTTESTFDIKEFHLKRIGKVKAFQIAISKYKRNGFLNNGPFFVFSELAHTLFKSGVSGINKKIKDFIRFSQNDSENKYASWCAMYDTITEDQFEIIKSLSESLSYQPIFSIIMPVYNAPVDYLKKAIESVKNQAYKNWELCIADDRSTNRDIRKLLEKYQSKEDRIKIIFRDVNGHISNASNSALELATGEYIALLDQDDELRPHSLYMIAKAINENRKLELVYSDEDKMDEYGYRFDPYFKTDWNKDLFYGQNMINHLGVYKLSLIKKIGGFRPGYEGSQDYDLALRCIEHLNNDEIHHIPHVLYHWRAIKGSTAVAVSNKNFAVNAGLKALKDHLKRTNQKATAQQNVHNSYRVKWYLPHQRPMVSIIIPTKNKADVLSICVTSILKKTSYENFEILIIDNNSDDPLALEYLDNVQKDYKQVKVYNYNSEFNFSALVNYGVEQSKGEIVLLLNNDTEVINEDWLSEIVSQCVREEIGAVGAKLYYPNGQIQHAGVFLYEGHPGNHIYLRKDKNDPGYFNKLNLVQNYSVVTGACLAVRKQLYVKVGGLDDKNLKVAYNDVDFCLKIRELGYRNLWTPFAQLIHHESLSRGNDLEESNFTRFKKEHGYMLSKWKNVISNDPFFNPNLGPDTRTNQFAFPPRLKYQWQIKEISKHD